MADSEIDDLIKHFARLPGLGPRSARRVVLQLVRKKDSLLLPLGEALEKVQNNIIECEICHTIDTCSPCRICKDDTRDKTQLCVVEDVGDLWALEKAGLVQGSYHVLGGCLSPLDGMGPKELHLKELEKRCRKNVKELILATNATMEGQATAHYIMDLLKHMKMKVKMTRLAYGVPIGGELDYLDEGTLTAAMQARR